MHRLLRQGLIFAAALIGAVLARKYLLGALETRIVWVTFYPAVMIASLFGGWVTGVLVAGTSCLIALYGWSWLAPSPFIKDAGDQLGMAAFVVNCGMIAAVAEVARQARVRALRAQKAAETANRVKDTFLASMSHELRTPLNAILGFSELLARDPDLAAPHRKTMDIIHRSGEHLLSLINNVLDLAKIEAGQALVKNEEFRLPPLFTTVVELMSQTARARNLRLECVLAPDLPPTVIADQGKLRQILVNLVGNALKFTPQGGVVVRAGWGPPDAEARLWVEVTDTGPGIAPEDQGRIFEPFVQLDTQGAQTGTGLGLALTRQFVAALGGEVSVRSRPGEGSTFRFTARVTPADPETGAPKPRLTAQRVAPGQPAVRCLVVDDEAENRELLFRILEQGGVEVLAVADGQSAIRTFQAWTPHLIWMDWRMPGMDGIEATGRIRALAGGDRVRIVVLSASVFPEDRDRVLASGADAFEPKPLTIDRIFLCLAQQLGVRLEAAEEAPSEAEPAPVDWTGALGGLSPGTRALLRGALTSLDQERIAAAVDQAAQEAPALATPLRERSSRFQYTALVQALDAGDRR